MVNGTVEHVVKHSVLYSYLLSQPFATYVDAYPVLQNKLLLEAEQLAYGQHDEIVRVLQKKLNTLAYYDDEVDGDYGILTEYALKKFQSDYHIEKTGQTDMETILALINVEKESHLKRLKNLSDSVYPGMHDDNVKIVQEALLYFGYYEGNIDGIYGPLTKRALQIAQDEHGIELMDEITQASLMRLYEEEQNNEASHESKQEENELAKDETAIEEKAEQKEKEPNSEIKVIEAENANHTNVIEVAESFIGTPYVWGGESPSGFDCSGFIQYVYQVQDIIIPRTVRDTWNFASPVNSPSVGDLVFFETYQPGPSHMGIYLGDGQFIHAGSTRGVEVSKLSNSYWESRYIGAKRIN